MADARILLVNPNTTASMTRKIEKAARSVAAAGTFVLAANPKDGPPSIEGFADGAYAVPGMLNIMRAAEAEGCDGFIIGCFDDTGLDAARSVVRGPVVGIGEAGFHLASLVAGRFSVVTTLARSVPNIEQNLVRYGLASRCARVRATEIAVLDLEEGAGEAFDKIVAEIKAAKADDRCDAIVLGCAGMTDLAAELTDIVGIPVVDGVACAVKLVEGLVALDLKTSKALGYAPPRPKTFSGRLAGESFT